MAIGTSLIATAARWLAPVGQPAVAYVSLALLFLAVTTPALAQTDPGVRTGAINGQSGATATSPLPLASVTNETPQGISEFFQNGLTRFQEVESVSGGANNGLGPRFNFNSCSGCHSQPAIGGSSPPNNPEFTATTSVGGPPPIASPSTNTVPSFLTAKGPTREARFPFFFNSSGTGVNTNAPNGGVEDLYTVSGRADAGSCSVQQPGFAFAQSVNDVIFRIPTPVFGAGLLENLDDSTLLTNQSDPVGQWPRHQRQFQPQRQRRHDHPLRLEGPEQVPGAVRRRGLQRGNGDYQRDLSAGATPARRGHAGAGPAGRRPAVQLPESQWQRLSGGCDQLRALGAQLGHFRAERSDTQRRGGVLDVHAPARAPYPVHDRPGRRHLDLAG